MSHPYYHARSAAQRWGGVWQDYWPIEHWFDSSKSYCIDPRHRMLLHQPYGIELCLAIFGELWQRPSDHQIVPTELIAIQHIQEDFAGTVPSLEQWFAHTATPAWLRPSIAIAAICVERFGGNEADYHAFETWFNRPQRYGDDPCYQLLVLNTFAAFLCEQTLGIVWQRPSDAKHIPTRIIAEAIINRMCGGYIPAPLEVLKFTPVKPWMSQGAKALSRQFAEALG
ncbi:hypothetical protein [Herpetosiphon gulosus]|uniref:DUF6915 domain-containing protein n=1 Tax=Herpetosiphon gulosus TaxID=1973496 RepID=A0ABP9X3E2_9CHLR